MEFRFATKVVIAVILLVFLFFVYPYYVDYKTHLPSNAQAAPLFEDGNRKMIFEEVSRLFQQTGRANNSTTAAIIKVSGFIELGQVILYIQVNRYKGSIYYFVLIKLKKSLIRFHLNFQKINYD